MKQFCIYLFMFLCISIIADAQENDRMYQASVASKILELNIDDMAALWFTDSDTGRAIAGARIEIKNAGTITTDTDGLAIFPMPQDGTYKFTLEKRGYIVLEDSFNISLGTIVFNKFSVPPTTPFKYVEIVIDWGAKPADLDLHLEKQGVYHVSYRDMQKTDDGNAWLDRDDTDGYGPETITISELDTNSTYSVYVQDYTNRNSNTSKQLSMSNAAVRIFAENKLYKVFNINPNSVATIWNVFEIRNGNIIPINTYKSGGSR